MNLFKGLKFQVEDFAEIYTIVDIDQTDCFILWAGRSQPVIYSIAAVKKYFNRGEWIQINSGKVDPVTPNSPKESIGILSCKICHIPNEYAAPNQPDNSFICFSCRN